MSIGSIAGDFFGGTGGFSSIFGNLFKSPSAPGIPDYTGAATATAQGSTQAAIANALLNRANQYTPYGSQTWDQTGTTAVPAVGSSPGFNLPNFSSNINLTPQGQQLLDADTRSRLGLAGLTDRATGQVGSSLSQPFSLGSTMPAYNQQVADALYNRSTRYLDPQFAQGEATQRDRLANAGFSQQDEGFAKSMAPFDRAKEMAYANARDTATTQAGTIGLNQRQQDISEQLLQRTQPLQELNALRTGASPQLPSFPSTNVGANAQGANLLGAAQATGQGQNDIYNSQVGTYNSGIGALGSVGSASLMALLMSDIRLKEDIRRIGKTDSGLPIYVYRYKGGLQYHMGVMAQEVEKVQPEAVFQLADGFKAVHYGLLS